MHDEKDGDNALWRRASLAVENRLINAQIRRNRASTSTSVHALEPVSNSQIGVSLSHKLICSSELHDGMLIVLRWLLVTGDATWNPKYNSNGDNKTC